MRGVGGLLSRDAPRDVPEGGDCPRAPPASAPASAPATAPASSTGCTFADPLPAILSRHRFRAT